MGRAIAAGIGAIVAILALSWLVMGNDFFLYKTFAPKVEQVRRDTFEQSRAFNEGMVRDLENLRLEYARTTDPAAKEALASTILHRASGYNMDDPIVPADLRRFVEDLRQGRLEAR